MEALRLQIVHLLESSGLTLEQMLFIVRDIYKDVDYSFSKQLLNQAEESRRETINESTEDIQQN